MEMPKLDIDKKGVQEFINSDVVVDLLESKAEEVADSANNMVPDNPMDLEPFKGYANTSGKIPIGRITTHSPYGEKHNAKNNTLLKALGGSS